MPTSYTPGQVALIQGIFKDPVTDAGLVASSIKLRITDPTGAETDVTNGFGNPDAGIYTWTVLVTTPGTWNYRWEVTAPFQAAAEGWFFVKTTTFSSPQ
jgi:hypothetical protein